MVLPDPTAKGVRDVFENAKCAWVFIGQNVPDEEGGGREGRGMLRGRPEHTDMIAHSGTWHMQLAGHKEWMLRPNPAEAWPSNASLQVTAAVLEPVACA